MPISLRPNSLTVAHGFVPHSQFKMDLQLLKHAILQLISEITDPPTKPFNQSTPSALANSPFSVWKREREKNGGGKEKERQTEFLILTIV